MPPGSLRKRAGQDAAQKSTASHPSPFPSQENDKAPQRVFWLGSSRIPRLPGFSQWHLRARSPYSCGTAQASYLFSRREAFYWFCFMQKSRWTFHLQIFPYYKRMILILQYRYPYGYIQIRPPCSNPLHSLWHKEKRNIFIFSFW